MYSLLYILMLVLVLPGIRIHNKTTNEIFDGMNGLNGLRGVVAILIIFTHCTLIYDRMPLVLLPFNKISTFGVGYFFLISGYGLAVSANTKDQYLSKFYKKILNLIWITVWASLLGSVLTTTALKEPFHVWLINWYLISLIINYTLFYLAYSKSEKSKRVIVLFLLIIVSTTLFLVADKATNGHLRSYYISQWAFPFGALMYEKADKLTQIMKGKIAKILLILILFSFFAIALVVPEKTFVDMLFHNLMILPLGILIPMVMSRVHIKNIILDFLNKISLEMYLFQFTAISIVRNWYFESGHVLDAFFCLYCLLLTIIIAVIVKQFRVIMKKLLKELKF